MGARGQKKILLRNITMSNQKMTKQEGVSNLLDGNTPNRGQGQEGEQRDAELEMRIELLDYLKNKFYFKDWVLYEEITDDEYLILWDAEHSRCPPLLKMKANEIFDKKVNIVATQAKLEYMLKQQRANANKSHAGHELGAREFTLTYSPKWFDDSKARELMRKAIDKLLRYYSNEIVELRAIGEVGSNGLSHVHCFYSLKGGLKITDKNFKRAYEYWNPKIKQGYTGHQGGHHATVRNQADFRGYIEKDVDTAWLDIYRGGVEINPHNQKSDDPI